MRFGPVAVQDAAGAVLAHAIDVAGQTWKKGRRLSEADLQDAKTAGIASVIAARFDDGDVAEDEAAAALAATLSSSKIVARAPATGRVNLYAEQAGLFRADRHLVDRLNAVDPAITLATLIDGAVVQAGQLVATVKIIPFATSRISLQQAKTVGRDGALIALAPFAAKRVGLIQTLLPGTNAKMLDKTSEVTKRRLGRSSSRLTEEMRCAHEVEALTDAISTAAARSELVLVFGASAVSDPADVIPAAIRAAGGVVERVGMPVDPGNLLVLGSLGDVPVVGAPGCARSPKENGFDWVLDRLLAGISVTSDDIAGLGVGGLLAEIRSRPAPRETASSEERGSSSSRTSGVAAIVLAAGRSSRMGDNHNKLLAEFDGVPLVRRVVEQVCGAGLDETLVVVGHQGDRVQEALSGLPLRFIKNDAASDGMSTSLKAGVAALLPQTRGALVVLADMPGVVTADFQAMLDVFAQSEGPTIVRATHGGKRGNPVLLPRACFDDIALLEGDVGARGIVESGSYPVVDVELGRAASLDVDTPEALQAAGGVLVR